MTNKRKQPKPKHWRTREQFVEAERKVREKRTAVFAQVWRHGQLVTLYHEETG